QPDGVDVDHALRIAISARVAPSTFAILFLRSPSSSDSFISRRALSPPPLREGLGGGGRAVLAPPPPPFASRKGRGRDLQATPVPRCRPRSRARSSGCSCPDSG